MIAAPIGAALILLVLTLSVARGFGEMAALRQEVIRSYEARSELQRILSLHQDLELGQRGYVITSDAVFLDPYREASNELNATFHRLDGRLAMRSALRTDLRALLDESSAKHRFAQHTINLTERGDVEAARRLVAAGEGKRLMDAIRGRIARIQELERAELGRRTEAAEAARRRLEGRTIAMLTLLLLITVAAVVLIARSSAARAVALRAAKDLAARNESIFEFANDGMIVLNPSGSIESLNPSAARMFGYPDKALLRRDIGTLFEIAPDRGRLETFFTRLEGHTEGRLRDVKEFVGHRADGTTFPLEVSLSPVRLADVTLFLLVTRDITDRRQIEQMKGEFVATVSHELRTPLTSIAGSLGLVTGGAAGELPPKAARLVQIAQSNSARLVRLINDILDIEKIEAGRMSFDVRPIALDMILKSAVQDNSGFATQYGVRLELAPVPTGAAVLADYDRLMQVLTNLLSNAIKFSPPDAVVTVQVIALDRRYRVSVIDRGTGIPEAFRDRIFNKFAQADGSDTRQKGGTGLGLSIVREIVTRLGGSITFDTQESAGTTFHVDLPAAELQRVAELSVEGETAFKERRSTESLPHVLHVDDDPDVLRVLSSAFEGLAILQSATSVEEARALIRRKTFDAAVLDVGMLDGSGLDLVPQLRQQQRRIPIVVFTAQEVEQCRAQDVDLTLVKSRASLERLVAEVMERVKGGQKERPA
ncbi:ATP-binding protein [Sphingomonas jeddahensis]|uniref:ATP-binding protein n=1 Tax=Sphingomonas jeddahensis TaxID=1915074 RepID=UPI000975FEFE|nr:ATP-binding protein [Sphingomonas jeddahensis]